MNKEVNLSSALVLLLCSASLLGCATAKPITGPHGKKGYVIECDSTHECYAKAVEMCEGGEYELMHEGGAKESGSSVGISFKGDTFFSSSKGVLIINCK